MFRYLCLGVLIDILSVDLFILFSLYDLWYELYIEMFGIYYKDWGGNFLENLVYEEDDEGNFLIGSVENGIVLIFKNVVNVVNEVKINYFFGVLNLGK